jgi:hypothetical protein
VATGVHLRTQTATRLNRFDRRLLANVDVGPPAVLAFCHVDEAGRSLLWAAMKSLHGIEV